MHDFLFDATMIVNALPPLVIFGLVTALLPNHRCLPWQQDTLVPALATKATRFKNTQRIFKILAAEGFIYVTAVGIAAICYGLLSPNISWHGLTPYARMQAVFGLESVILFSSCICIPLIVALQSKLLQLVTGKNRRTFCSVVSLSSA